MEKLESSLVEQLKEAVHRREIFYVTCYTWVGYEATRRATAVAATATGGGATRTGGRGVAITSISGGGAASCCASHGAAGVRS